MKTPLGFNQQNIVAMEQAEGYYDFETQVNGWVDDTVIFNYLVDLLKKDEKQFVYFKVLHPYFIWKGFTGINP